MNVAQNIAGKNLFNNISAAFYGHIDIKMDHSIFSAIVGTILKNIIFALC